MVELKIFEDREAWLENRKQYIGGSDASAIVGMNPWKSNVDLWLEKTGQVIPEDISGKDCVQFGINVEPIMRELFKLNYPQYEVHYEEYNSWTNDKYPFAAVSHDGWITERETGRKGIWECKSTEIVSSMAKEKWAGRLPDNYYVQLLHSFLIREDCEFAHLTALLTFKFKEKELYQQIKNYHIERSEVQADIEYLAQQEKIFYEKNIQGRRQPDLILPNI